MTAEPIVADCDALLDVLASVEARLSAQQDCVDIKHDDETATA